MKIYHNPRCAKSRDALALLDKKKIEAEVYLYLEEKNTQKSIREVLKKLNIKASELVRKSEKIYKEEFKGKDISEKEWVKILSENPKLIERPIIINGDKAVIGRPTEKILEIL